MPDAPDTVMWDQLAEHFESARRLQGDARAAFVRTVCGHDPSLEAELQSLLAVADAASDDWRPLHAAELAPILIAAARAEDTDRSPPPALGAPTLTGSRIRHYQVLEPLGAGGMGVVHRGRDTRLGREVALKFLSADRWVDPDSRARFEREARAVSSLDAPHICALHAIEETEHGALCLVMAYCAGGTLRDRLRAGPLDLASAVRISIDLAEGLASAHERRIVHGDLKPANVGFTHDDVTKILDFGLAVRLGDDLQPSRDGQGGFAGTLPYAAPELLRGGMPSFQTDLWALGVVCYELLAGHRPFVHRTEGGLVMAILDDAPPPIERFADSLSAPATQSLQALIASLLAKDPAARPASAAEVSSAFRSWWRTHGDRAPRVDESQAPGLGAGRHRRRWWLAGMVGVSVAALLLRNQWPDVSGTLSDVAAADSTALPVAAPVLPTLAVLPFTVRGEPSLQYLREGMVDLLTPVFDATGLVRGVDPNTVIGAAPRSATGMQDATAARGLARAVGASRYVVGSLVQAGERLTLRATIYRADGHEAARAQVEVDSLEGILRGAESLVRQLASAELRSPGDTVAAVAASTTASTSALRAFLDGERALRDARPAEAVTHFSTAVARDSLFALAWYRLARAARWSEVDSLSRHAAARANALAATLPLRLQQVVRSYHALRFGSPLLAERGFRQIVADYPSDVEAWMLLGETRFENYPLEGRSSAEAVEAFQRVMALDPRNREITVYLMELAARDERHPQLDTLFSMYFSPNSAGEQPGIRETFLALHARRVRGVEYRITDPLSAQTALRRIGSLPADRRAARAFAEVLTRPTVAPMLRLDGWLALGSLAVASAQPGEAARAWRAAAAIDAPMALLHEAMTTSAPGSPFAPDEVRALRRRLAAAPVATGSGPLTRPEWDAVRRYLLGLLSLRVRDTVGLQQARDGLAVARADDRLARPLREALDAHLSFLRGDLAGALSALQASDAGLPAATRRRVPALAQFSERRLYAEVLQALGRREEASLWATGLRHEPGVWGLPFLGLATE
jgi:serine/threonine protein kinase